jgi:lipopolysaccharide assembly outer membrane protein LptD (OstA)
LLSYFINQSASLAFTHTTIEDDYDPIAWASLESRDISTSTLDFTWSPNLDYSLSIYAGIESYEIEQSGYGSLGNESSRWAYDIDDDSVLFGVSGKASAFSGKVEFRLDYRYQKGEGDYETIDPSQVSGSFPDLETTISALTLRADIKLYHDWMINVSYHYEDYHSDSWVWKNDYDEPGSTYFNVLDYGYDSPNYVSHLFMVAAAYRF